MMDDEKFKKFLERIDEEQYDENEQYKIFTNRFLVEKGIEWCKKEDVGIYYDVDGFLICYDEFYYNSIGADYFKNSRIGFGKPYTGLLYQTYGCSYKIDKEDEDYEDGSMMYYVFYADGHKIGDEVKFYQNGNLQYIMSVDRGSPYGRYFEWFENGSLCFEGYKLASQDVLYRKYNENGILIEEKTELAEKEKQTRRRINPYLRSQDARIDMMKSIKNYRETHKELTLWDENYMKELELYWTRSFAEQAEEAIANGAMVDVTIPDTIPENMYPPNAIRRSLKGEIYLRCNGYM